MEGEAAAAVLQTLVQNLIDLCKKEISQIRDLDKNAAKLAGNLDMIKNFLNDAETRTITSGAIKNWLKKLEDMAFDADNVLDEINYNILSKQIKSTEPEEEKVPSCFSCYKDLLLSRNMALTIKGINENLESINKEAANLGLVEKLANEPTLVIASSETDSFSDDPVFIGRDNVESEIVEMITNSITTDKRKVSIISIISIVGMGGLGKTTLTRKVFNRLKNETRFGSHIWVHVSPSFDPIILFKKILKELSNQVEGESKQDILSKLQQALKDKTYLLVLDDVWNEDHSKWEDFFNSLLGVSCVKGNAIVVTTRSTKVASIVKPIHTNELEGLSVEECWSIIKVKTFGEGNAPSEFETIGKRIARKCQGLPLAANVVGGILSNQSDEEKWCSIEEKWLSADEEGDNITKILRLSFDNLSLPSLKKCFAYCAMFPKGSKINKPKLIEMWMAEGFLQADGRDDMESLGEEFINVLLHNSLLQVSERDYYGNVKSCGMHDLVHDLACSVSSSSNSTGGSSRVRYMILGDNYCGDESSHIPKEMAKSLHTLLITSKADISDINFSDLESLHVLRLDSEVKELPSSIQKLIHLRDFDISKTRIEVLPDWIGEFFHLQTLRVDTQAATFDFRNCRIRIERKLPSTIKYLINLRHLYINSWTELPMGIGRLTSLQTLTHFPVGDKNGCKIEELGSLINLKGELEIRNLERVHDKEEAGKANLFKKSKILKLCLTWNRGRREGERNDEDVLEGLQPHSDLRVLQIDGFNGKRFPLWTEKMSVRDAPQGSWLLLHNLKSLMLNDCRECEEIPMLGQLPNLHTLLLDTLSNVKCINSSFYGMMNKDTRIVFPALERFELSGMHKLAEWAEIEISDGSEVKLFPRLQHLEIRGCQQLKSVPMLWHLPNLKSLVLWGLSNVKCINSSFYGMVNTRIVFPALEVLTLIGMRKLAEWAEIEISDGSEVKLFPRLQHLEIHECEQLMNVPSLGQLPNLKSLQLSGLDNVKCINSSFYGMVNTRIVFPALEVLTLIGMPKLAEWAEIEISDGSEVKLFPRLQHLYIYDCKQLKSVPSHVSSCLEELWIDNIGVKCLPADWLLSNSETLSKLVILNCPNLREISDRWGEEESEGRSFTITSLPKFPRLSSCPNLREISDRRGEEESEGRSFTITSLPKFPRLSSCPNLREISDRCGEEESEGRSFTITSLPIFPRLTTLQIEDVPKLSVATVAAMRRLQIDGNKYISP